MSLQDILLMEVFPKAISITGYWHNSIYSNAHELELIFCAYNVSQYIEYAHIFFPFSKCPTAAAVQKAV